MKGRGYYRVRLGLGSPSVFRQLLRDQVLPVRDLFDARI